jgi:hypothetical protein
MNTCCYMQYCDRQGIPIATDQNISMPIRHEENVSERDRQLASDMDGREHDNLHNANEGVPISENLDNSDPYTVWGNVIWRFGILSEKPRRLHSRLIVMPFEYLLGTH